MALKLEQFKQVVKFKGVQTQKTIALRPETAVTAGGDPTAALTLGAGLVGIYVGSGTPSITAVQGSMYFRTDGSSASTRLYINTTGSTTWTAVTTAA